MIARPCLSCGSPSRATRCPACTIPSGHTTSSTRRGYDERWRRLSERARAAQPFCSDCGTTEDLTTDHSAEAWARRAAGLVIRLSDVDVVCRSCNGARGPARDGAIWGGTPPRMASRPPGKAQGRLHTPGGFR